MYLNQFSVRVIGGSEGASGYVSMRHGQKYSLSMRNGHSVRCDAQVEIDGKPVGTWRINHHDTITIERPAHDPGQFTFYKLNTPEAASAGLNSGDPNMGLVKVTFTPEREYHPVFQEPTWPLALDASVTQNFCSCSYNMPQAKGLSAGGTGLSGHSSQQFYTASQIEYDYSQQAVIHLRLVCEEYDGPRPLTSYSTPVPPRVW